MVENLQDMPELFGGRCWQDLKGQVGTASTSIEQVQSHTDFACEVVHHVSNHVRFGGGRQAHDGRDWAAAGSLLDESPDIPVIRSEVVTPL